MKLLLACLLAASAVPAHALRLEKIHVIRPVSAGGVGDIVVVSGAALVRFDVSVDSATRRAVLAQRGMTMKGEVGPTGWTHVVLPSGMSVSAGISLLQAVPGVIGVEPDHAYGFKRTPNDPSFSQQWHLAKIDAPAAWEYGVGDSTRVTVAVIDVGIDGTHPDLSGKLVGTSQFCTPGPNQLDTPPDADDTGCVADNPPTAACNHATRVAGIAAATSNNGSGVAGVSWGAKLLSLRVFRTQDCNLDCSDSATDSPLCNQGTGTPCCSTDDEAIVQALEFARQANNQPAYGRIVVNMSLGEAGNTDCATHSALQNEINFATGGSTGVVIAVATGNESSDVTVPASCNGVIPVGATDSNDNVAYFSNQGPKLAANGVAAPGVGLTTTDLGGGVVTNGATGTSFATPIVAGLSALILSFNPSLSPAQVRDNLRGSTDSIGLASVSSARPTSNAVGAGRVNAFKASKLTVEGTLAGFAGAEKVIAFPNPFRMTDTSNVTISVPNSLQGRNTSVRVYGIDGQLIRDLKAQTTWDGKNDHGAQVASGVYLILVKTDAGTQTTKLALIR